MRSYCVLLRLCLLCFVWGEVIVFLFFSFMFFLLCCLMRLCLCLFVLFLLCVGWCVFVCCVVVRLGCFDSVSFVVLCGGGVLRGDGCDVVCCVASLRFASSFRFASLCFESLRFGSFRCLWCCGWCGVYAWFVLLRVVLWCLLL